jgi:hypothetical protein
LKRRGRCAWPFAAERLGDERAQAKDKEDTAGEDDEADEGDGFWCAL